MLTGLDIETVAFCEEWGEWYCPACAANKWGSLTCAKAERGLSTGQEIEAVSRYEMITSAEEQGFQLALDRLVRFKAEHPAFAETLQPDIAWPIETRVVTRFAFWCGREHCSECSTPLVSLPDLQKVGVWT